ncbi:MAG: phosphoribosylglycinamide formyltransferase [Bacteroidota bacterium]|nr:phosphoribosylglycinamide formyltransferase [Bacteroidota bacterium]
MNKIAIFASGNGTNAENIIKYFKNNKAVEVALVCTNNPKAKVIQRASNLNTNSFIFHKKELSDSSIVLDKLKENKIDFIVLAGFMLLIPSTIIEYFPNRIINIHPALLPKYGGKGMYGDNVHKAVLTNNESETGITIHYVNEKYDEGDIIFQIKCNVDPSNDSINDVANKVHLFEYKYYPKIIEQLLTKFLLKKEK